MVDIKKEKWTVSRSLLLLILLLDLTLVAGWLFFYFEHYQKISTVIAGIWTAVVTLLSFMRVKTKKSISFSSFLGLLPVKIIVITYTILIFSLSLVFSLWEFPVHLVQIEVQTIEEKVQIKMVWTNGDTIRSNNNGIWEFYAKKGIYQLKCQPDGYKEKTTHVTVDLFCLSQKFQVSGFEKSDGCLQIGYSPSKINISISNEPKREVIARKHYTRNENAFIDLPWGRYWIKAESKNYLPDSQFVNINAQCTTEVVFDLLKLSKPIGKLQILTQPPEMEIILNDDFTNKLTPNTLSLSPNHYLLELKKRYKDYYGFYMKKKINIKKNVTTKIDTTLHAFTLCLLTVLPMEPNWTYYLDEVPLGSKTETFTIKIFPGSHLLSKKRNEQTIYKSIVINEEEKNKLVKF
jgi:hypothetical protein